LSSETTEASSTLPPPDTQAGRCSRNLHQTFDPLMQNLITNIKSELSTFQESLGSQFQGGPQVMITDQHEMATLVAEKLYAKIKEDLITSGNSIINEELNGMKERIDGVEETIQENKVESLDSLKETIEETLQKDKQNRFYFSAYDDEGGDVTGQLKFPKIVTNLGGAFDGSSGTFTAPVKGVYTFSFSGQQSGAADGGGFTLEGLFSEMGAIDLYVRKNGATVFGIYDDRNTSGEKQKFQNINSIFSLDLNENDTVNLFLGSDDKLYATSRFRLIFMGQLVVAT